MRTPGEQAAERWVGRRLFSQYGFHPSALGFLAVAGLQGKWRTVGVGRGLKLSFGVFLLPAGGSSSTVCVWSLGWRPAGKAKEHFWSHGSTLSVFREKDSLNTDGCRTLRVYTLFGETGCLWETFGPRNHPFLPCQTSRPWSLVTPPHPHKETK